MSEVKHVDPIQGEIIHEYDGIMEADNHLPLWWLWTLFGAMIFAVGYWFYYQEFKAAPGLQGAYFAEKAAEQEKTGADPTNEQLMAAVGTPAEAMGKDLFAANCAACHDAQGQGKIGPNLTDNAWIHGGSPLDIFHTVRDGVGAKGMPSWGPTLGRAGVEQVVAFVLAIRDTNVAGGKAAEGEPYDPSAQPAGEAGDEGAQAEPAAADGEQAEAKAAAPEEAAADAH